MAKTVYIRIQSDYSVSWAVSGDDGNLTAQSGTTLDQAGDICHGKKVVVFIPGDMIHLGTYLIPARSRQKILQAVPFAVEDDLIGDVDDFHFAIPARTPANNIPVCAITHEQIEAIQGLLGEHNIQAQVIITETLSLPLSKETWTVLLEDDKSTVRTSIFGGFTVDSCNLEDYMEIALQDAGDELPARLDVMDFRSMDKDEPLSALIPDVLSDSLELQEVSTTDPIINILINSYREGDAINLLQGNYGIRHMRSQNWSKWYPTAAALMLILLIKATGGIIEYVQLSNESGLLDQQIKQVFRQSLPDVKRIVNPKAQMQQRLSSLKSSSQHGKNGFFTYLSNTVKALGSDSSIILKGISFRNNHMDIELGISDLQALEKLKTSISQTGSKVDIKSAAVQGKTVSARLRITGEDS